MRKLSINAGEFKGLKNSDFVVNVQKKIEALTANVDTFPDPTPTLADLNTNYQDLMFKTVTADGGSTDQKNARDMQRGVVTAKLYQLMAYVMGVAARASTEDEQDFIIDLAKFVPSKSKQRIGPVARVENVNAAWTGNEGEVEVKFKRVHGARSYKVQITTSDPASTTPNWVDYDIIPRSKIVLTGLQPLSKIWCRVIAYGTTGASTPSDPAMSVVG